MRTHDMLDKRAELHYAARVDSGMAESGSIRPVAQAK